MEDLSTLIPIPEARERILDRVAVGPSEEVPLLDSLGRVLARDLTSDIDIAPFDNTAMDGFACKSEDLKNATEESPVSLEIVDHLGAGFVYKGTVESGQTVRIMTGAPIPDGCDTVVKFEIVTWTGEGTTGDTASFFGPSDEGKNIRHAGEEARKGDVVVHAGEVISPAGIGLLASTGHERVPVFARPTLGIVSLGSELVGITDTPGPGQIRNSNASALAAEARACGANPVLYPTCEDDEAAITAMVEKATNECDFVISSGGASGGDFDYITQAADTLGVVYFKYVDMKPGKSQTFAMIGDTPFFGLAGNPTAAVVGFEMLVRPALRKMQGFTLFERPFVVAKLAKDARKKGDVRTLLLRGRIEKEEDGGYTAHAAKNQSSALFKTFHESNCLILVPHGLDDVPAGTEVPCLRIDMEEGTVV